VNFKLLIVFAVFQVNAMKFTGIMQ